MLLPEPYVQIIRIKTPTHLGFILNKQGQNRMSRLEGLRQQIPASDSLVLTSQNRMSRLEGLRLVQTI